MKQNLVNSQELHFAGKREEWIERVLEITVQFFMHFLRLRCLASSHSFWFNHCNNTPKRTFYEVLRYVIFSITSTLVGS